MEFVSKVEEVLRQNSTAAFSSILLKKFLCLFVCPPSYLQNPFTYDHKTKNWWGKYKKIREMEQIFYDLDLWFEV